MAATEFGREEISFISHFMKYCISVRRGEGSDSDDAGVRSAVRRWLLARREDDDVLVFVGHPVQVFPTRESAPIYGRGVLVEHDVPDVVFFEDPSCALARRVVQHPLRVPQRP